MMNRCEVCGSPVEVVSSDEGTHHYRPAGQERIAALEAVIHDTLWMARRYASGRQTYAPSLVNQAIDTLAGMGITLRPDHTLVDDGGPSDTYAHDPVRERLEAENKRLREALKNAARDLEAAAAQVQHGKWIDCAAQKARAALAHGERREGERG